MDVGTHLRTARERLGLSAAAVSARTRISPRMIRAIEENDTATLPQPVFVRGFLRSYAAEVGLDPEPLVTEYMAQVAPPPAAATAERDEALAGERMVFSARGRELTDFGDSTPRASTTAGLLLAALALAVVSHLSMQANPPAATPTEPLSEASPTTGSAAVASVAPAVNNRPVGTSGQALTIDIHPTGPCWVEVRVNGEARIYRLMQAGERESVTADGEVMMRVGDPTEFAYSINGRRGRPLAITSNPVTVRFRADTASQFIG